MHRWWFGVFAVLYVAVLAIQIMRTVRHRRARPPTSDGGFGARASTIGDSEMRIPRVSSTGGSGQGTVEYHPTRAMLVYHWAAAFLLLAIAVGLTPGVVLKHPPPGFAWYPDGAPLSYRAGLVVMFVGGVVFMQQRAWFVAFTRARSTPEQLIIRKWSGHETHIPWQYVDGAQTFSLGAAPAGWLRLVRLYVGDRTVIIPLGRHPRDDELFASIAQRANLAPEDPNWRTDTVHSGFKFVRREGQAGGSGDDWTKPGIGQPGT